MWWLAGYRASYNSVILARRIEKWVASVASNTVQLEWRIMTEVRGSLFENNSFHANGTNVWKQAARDWCWRGADDEETATALSPWRAAGKKVMGSWKEKGGNPTASKDERRDGDDRSRAWLFQGPVSLYFKPHTGM